MVAKNNLFIVFFFYGDASQLLLDACPLARALDVVGEQWALLIIRELLFGPRRFSDLRRALPGASTNMLTDRLRELSEHDVVARRRLPAPAASVVYELTEDEPGADAGT